jgi:hypothetical protein
MGNPLQVRVWTLDTATKGVLVDMAATVQDTTSQLIKDFRLTPEALSKRDWKLYGFLGTEQSASLRFNGGIHPRTTTHTAHAHTHTRTRTIT